MLPCWLCPLCQRCVDQEILEVEKCWWWRCSETLVPLVGGGPMVGYMNVTPSPAADTTYSKSNIQLYLS